MFIKELSSLSSSISLEIAREAFITAAKSKAMGESLEVVTEVLGVGEAASDD
ncbi:hypothetical protein [Nostoc sp. FACHB-892]